MADDALGDIAADASSVGGGSDDQQQQQQQKACPVQVQPTFLLSALFHGIMKNRQAVQRELEHDADVVARRFHTFLQQNAYDVMAELAAEGSELKREFSFLRHELQRMHTLDWDHECQSAERRVVRSLWKLLGGRLPVKVYLLPTDDGSGGGDDDVVLLVNFILRSDDIAAKAKYTNVDDEVDGKDADDDDDAQPRGQKRQRCD